MNSVFQQDNDVYTIDIGSTIIDSYSLYEYAYFTLDMSIDNLAYFDEEGNYNYNISVEATSEKLGNSSDAVDIPVDIRYSHGSWSITSMITPTNTINILNSNNASVSIDFSHSECEDYLLYGTLYVVPDGNMDIFTLDYISRNIYIEGNYSTGESFDVIGCSDNLNDIFVDIIFDGEEEHSAIYSLTACALAVTNLTDEISIFTGLEDADNDGTNNVNDLDNAGSFMPFLVKTHESATNVQFRLDFDETKIKIWVKDGTMTRTDTYLENSGDVLPDLHAYSYNDLFALGSETNIYVQALEPGEHDVDVTYLLDGHDLWTESVSFTSVELKIKCNDEFFTVFMDIYKDPIRRDNPESYLNFVSSWRIWCIKS